MSSDHSSLPASRAEWHRRTWALAGPIIISNVSVPLVGLVDTAVVGHLPEPIYIAAVAVGAMLFSFVFWGFGFLRMGTTGLVSQAFGRHDGNAIRTLIAQGALLALMCALIVLLMQGPILRLGLHFVDGSEGLKSLAGGYYHWRIWATPGVLLNYLVLGVLIGLQNTRAALVTQLTLNLTNILLDLIFVPVLGMGVEGVAIASLIAEYSALIVGALMIRNQLSRIRGHWDADAIADSAGIKALLHVNTNIMIRTLLLVGVFAYFTILGSRFGESVLAANAVLVQLLHLMAFGLDGFAHAAEALTGQTIGARSRQAFKDAVRVTTQWAAAMAILIAACYWLAGTFIVALISDIPEVRETAAIYLPWLVLAPLLSIWSYQLDGVFIGATRSVEMRNAMIVSALFFVVASAALVDLFDNHGLWMALLTFNLVRAISLYLLMGRIHSRAEKWTE